MHSTQQKLLKLIGRENLYDVPLRKIGERLGNEDTAQTVKHHLGQLVKKGLIRINHVKKRIEVIESGSESSHLVSIPILGSANCGEALTFARENLEGHLQVSTNVLGEWSKKAKHLFALHAVGPSMNKAKDLNYPIEDGDYVIIDETDREPKNRDYVLSIINGCANIKRYFEDKTQRQIALISESSENIPPIYIHEMDKDDYLINGKVALVMKNPENWVEFGELDPEEATPDLVNAMKRSKKTSKSTRTNL